MDNLPTNELLPTKDLYKAFSDALAEFGEPAALVRIDKTRKEASFVFNSSIAVRQWMLLKNETLGNETPLRLSGQSEEGRQRVSEVLKQIEHGIYL